MFKFLIPPKPVVLRSPDVARLRSFYQDVLDVCFREDRAGYLTSASARWVIDDIVAAASAEPSGEIVATGLVDALDEAAAELAYAGAFLGDAVTLVDGSRRATFADPDGNLVALVQLGKAIVGEIRDVAVRHVSRGVSCGGPFALITVDFVPTVGEFRAVSTADSDKLPDHAVAAAVEGIRKKLGESSVEVVFTDGYWHEVDSAERHFTEAGRMAVTNALVRQHFSLLAEDR